MRLRIILPPNLESAASRDAIPTKLEIQLPSGKGSPPEKVPPDALGQLNDAQRAAAFSLLQWCGGSLSSFLQLNREQLAQLVQLLAGEPAFFWANAPRQPIDWNHLELIGVSEHLATQPPSESQPPQGERAPQPAAGPRHVGVPTLVGPSTSATSTDSPHPSETTEAEPDASWKNEYAGTPMTIDGSTHFLCISLPSRQHPYYQEIRDLLETNRFKLEPANRKWWLRDRHKTLSFLADHWDDLQDRYAAEFKQNFLDRTKSIRDAQIDTQVSENRNGYTLHLSVRAGQATEQEINQSLNTGQNYLERDGKVYLFRKSRLQALQKAQRHLLQDPNAPLLQKGVYQVGYSQTPQAEEILDALDPNFEPPATWRSRSRALRDLSTLDPATLPPHLDQTLRPYQKIGVSWLNHLFQHSLGGILADEMGLGKTLQALALLASLHRSRQQAKRPPSIVVCPASLVENWRREAARFCPELKVFLNHGASRIDDADTASRFDLIITSYGTLIRDQQTLQAIEYLCVIGDEAQHIKNRRTLNAKAIAALSAQGRFLLTGTPVENSIQDLISLLDFIMPGGWKGIPEGSRGEERRWHEQRIKDQAGPYILRRSKESVAPELPEKIEQVLYLDMSEAQRRAYQQVKAAAESEIASLVKSGASEGALRMKTLTQLLRLRQTCCDPRLVDPQLAPADSTKLESFRELLEEAIDGSHRILVFSQFVSLLSLLKDELEAMELDYCYIDGSTRDRMAQVDRFQNDPTIPLFLISLKAGGTGLNLTAADTVIHFDPWWNPAAEAQATDRAHRIGQTKVVTSYKLIVAESVEENVLNLQQSKRQLLQDIFDASEAANASLSLADLKSLL